MVDNTEAEDAIEIEPTESEEAQAEPSSDLRATLEAAFKESSASISTEEEPFARQRDERGRFASTKQDSDQATQVKVGEAQTEPIAPPYSWSAEHKELFSQLPRNMQEYLTRREQERESFIGRKSQETAAIKDKYAPVDRLIEQYGETFRRANMDPYQGIESLVLAQQYLDRDPVGALRLMAQSYGLDLSQLAGSSTSTSSQPAYPQMHYLTNELDTIRGKLAAIENEKIAQQTQHAISEVESFANEMDQGGKLLRPFMADVHEQMMDEVRLLRSRHPDMAARQVLQQAYETACWKNADVRSRLIEQHRAPQAQAARVQQAKLAGSSVRGAPGASGLATGSGNSVRDALLAAFDAHT